MALTSTAPSTTTSALTLTSTATMLVHPAFTPRIRRAARTVLPRVPESEVTVVAPPFLELQYYVGRDKVDDALQLLVHGVERGAVPRNLVVADAVGLSSPEEVDHSSGIVLLRTHGGAFCGPDPSPRAPPMKLGRRVYERFVEVADRLPVVYGAILVEYSLEEPHELSEDPRSYAFCDFSLSRERLEKRTVSEVLHVAGDDSYVEIRTTGVYVSMSRVFNPMGRDVDDEDAVRSEHISRILGRDALAIHSSSR